MSEVKTASERKAKVVVTNSLEEYVRELSQRMILPKGKIEGFKGILSSPDQLAPLVEKTEETRIELKVTTPSQTRFSISSDIKVPERKEALKTASRSVQLASLAEAEARFRIIRNSEHIPDQVRYGGFNLDRTISKLHKQSEKLIKGERVFGKTPVEKKMGILALSLAAAACGTTVTPRTPEAVQGIGPVATEVTQIPTEIMPIAGAEDEMSTAIQDYLNKEYTELGISEVKEVGNVVSIEGGEIFNFATSVFKNKETGEEKNLPLLIRLNKDGSVNSVILLVRNENPSGVNNLLKYEFLGYGFDPETGNLITQGSLVQRLKTGEFKIKSGGEWKIIMSPTDRHISPLKGLLTDEGFADPTAFFEIVTPEATPTEELPEMPPLVQPESLVIRMNSELLQKLNIVDVSKFTPYSGPQGMAPLTEITSYEGKAEELISLMGVSDYPDLIELYRAYFDTWWAINPWHKDSGMDIRGLGSEVWNYPLPSSQQDVGFFYGFVDSGLGYLVLQIKPGSDLTPEQNPEAFISTRPASPPTESGLLGLRYINEFGKAEERYILKSGTSSPHLSTWTMRELQEEFGLKRGSIISTTNTMAEDGHYTVWQIFIHVNEFPTEEEMAGKYELIKYGDIR
ncbi:hypothetical protein KKH23_01780 [Patescibacteria group bacterium]|nr:hypothetical protein [Patescibacteria group bacterium]MBU0777218.1 hypothetical protein [Patescibacteria group bacterium]MBU0845913.1 hypothetical protein [Patescibacteria group bacterium]MBU0922940.1 hypothetical protein [Patescibacteria group bacterium]